jgi:hypothetical protein
MDQIHQDTGVIESKVDSGDTSEFAMNLFTQIRCCTVRIFQQYWHTPSYIWGKVILGLASALYVTRPTVRCAHFVQIHRLLLLPLKQFLTGHAERRLQPLHAHLYIELNGTAGMVVTLSSAGASSDKK